MTRPADISEAVWEWADIFIDEHRAIEDDRELVARAYLLATQVPIRAGLTPIQAEVLGFIEQHQAQHHSAPSYGEIAAAAGMASKSGAHRVVQQLIDRNAIAMLPHRPRSITIVGRA